MNIFGGIFLRHFFLLKNCIKIHIHFLNRYFVLFCLAFSFLSSLYSLDINPLSYVQLTMISTHSLGFLVTLLIIFLVVWKTFDFMKSTCCQLLAVIVGPLQACPGSHFLYLYHVNTAYVFLQEFHLQVFDLFGVSCCEDTSLVSFVCMWTVGFPRIIVDA